MPQPTALHHLHHLHFTADFWLAPLPQPSSQPAATLTSHMPTRPSHPSPLLQLGTHKRGKAKREEMAALLRKMAAKHK